MSVPLSRSNLVSRIHSVNHGWKISRERFGKDDPLSQSLRDLKARLQIRLLRHPDIDTRLEIDSSIESEVVYGIVLSDSDATASDAAHIPYRTLERYLNPTELRELK